VCSLQPLAFAAVHAATTAKKDKIKPTVYYAGIDSDAVHETADEGTASDASARSMRSVVSNISAGPKPIRRFGQNSMSSGILDLGKAPPVQG